MVMFVDFAVRWAVIVSNVRVATHRDDAMGNIYGTLWGTDRHLSSVATGSHTDAIPLSGMYDGTLGVIGGVAAVAALSKVVCSIPCAQFNERSLAAEPCIFLELFGRLSLLSDSWARATIDGFQMFRACSALDCTENSGPVSAGLQAKAQHRSNNVHIRRANEVWHQLLWKVRFRSTV